MFFKGFEFNVFRSMLEDENIRPYLPEQIAFELHSHTQMTQLAWEPRYKTVIEIYHFLHMIQEVGGYEIVSVDLNASCGHCVELVVMRDVGAKSKTKNDIMFNLEKFLNI